MGHTQSISTSQSRNVSMSSESGTLPVGKSKHGREHKRHGVVTLKMVSANPVRRGAEAIVTHTITPKGCILFGSQHFNPTVVQNAIVGSGYPLVPPTALPLADPRAHKILVTYCKGWHIIPFPEVFSRHSGTCLILGDRTITSPPFQIKVGDCFRLGSVGLVVSEMRADGENEQRIDAKTLEFLKDEALAFDTSGDMATLAADEEKYGIDGHSGADGHGDGEADDCNTPVRGASSMDSVGTNGYILDTPECKPCAKSPNLGSGGITPGERFVCYMCYENHDTEDDALVAPCDCKGDTRYLHVQCLQKWYQASITGIQTQVIRTTGNGAPACKICGSAYKTAFRRADGRKASLLETESNGPYLSLVVVTKHDTNPGLFNTKFRLNFHSRLDTTPFMDHQEDNIITIGRSSSCNMILDYRTVSTIHARITYEDGKFYLTDRRSSNGTMVYLQDPFPLPYQHALKLRMGRTTLSLQAKRNWTSALRNMLGSPIPSNELLSPTPDDIQCILASCTTPGEDDMAHTIKEDTLTNDEDLQRHDNDSPNRTFGIRTVPNLSAPQDEDREIDWTGAQQHPRTGNSVLMSSDAANSSTFNQYSHQHTRLVLNEDPSVRTLNSAGNSSFHSASSSVTGLTSVPAHVLSTNTALNSHSAGRSRPAVGNSQPPDYAQSEYDFRYGGVSPPVGLLGESVDSDHRVPDEFLSEEDRQLEADMRRAIELSLAESQSASQRNRQAAELSPQPREQVRMNVQQPREGGFQRPRSPHPPMVRALSERSDAPDGTRHSQSATSIGDAGNAKVSADYVSMGGSISANVSRPHSAVGNVAAALGLVKSGSKALLDYTQPDCLDDSENSQQSPNIIVRKANSAGRSSRSPAPSSRGVVGSPSGSSLGGTANVVGGSIVMHDNISESHVLATDNAVEQRVPSAGRQAEQELSTALPVAGAFTTYGQLSNRKSTPNLAQHQEPAPSSVSKEKAQSQDQSSEQSDRVGPTSNKERPQPASEKEGKEGKGSQKRESPHSMLRNTTAIDLETSLHAPHFAEQQHASK